MVIVHQPATRQRSTRTSTALRLALVCAAVVLWEPSLAGATGAGGAATRPTGAAPAPGSFEPPPRGTYRPPLRAPVADPFRAPPHPYGAGNRGIEYATTPGQEVSSIGSGMVTFAGPVGGRLAVTVAHPDGRRSSYTWLAAIAVEPGDLLPRGATLGSASALLHLGVREGERYVDPAGLFDRARRRAVLVRDPIDRPGRPAS